MTELEAVCGVKFGFLWDKCPRMQEYWFYGRFWCDEKMPKRFPEFLCHFTFPPAVCDLVHPHACQHLVCCSFYSYFSVHFTTTSGIHELIRSFGVISWTDFWMDFKNTVEFPGSLASLDCSLPSSVAECISSHSDLLSGLWRQEVYNLEMSQLADFPPYFWCQIWEGFFCHKH